MASSGRRRQPEPERVRMRADQLVEDPAIWPRDRVDEVNVAEMCRALDSGCALPLPLIADRKSKRIIQGVHRRRAFIRTYGPDTEVDVELRSYASVADMLTAAYELQDKGKGYSTSDKTRVVLRLQEEGLSLPLIAQIMGTTQRRVERLAVRVVHIRPPEDPRFPPGQPVKIRIEPAKPVALSRDGVPRVLTPEQIVVMRSSGGWRTAQTLQQLTREIACGLVDLGDPSVVRLLWRLHDVIAEHVPGREPAA